MIHHEFSVDLDSIWFKWKKASKRADTLMAEGNHVEIEQTPIEPDDDE